MCVSCGRSKSIVFYGISHLIIMLLIVLVQRRRGCLQYSKAAASAIGAMAPGVKAESMLQICHHMAAMLNGDVAYTPLSGWEVLAAFEPVKAHKNRRSCVLLPFQAVAMVLNNDMSKKF